jgi:hypothetical protein
MVMRIDAVLPAEARVAVDWEEPRPVASVVRLPPALLRPGAPRPQSGHAGEREIVRPAPRKSPPPETLSVPAVPRNRIPLVQARRVDLRV